MYEMPQKEGGTLYSMSAVSHYCFRTSELTRVQYTIKRLGSQWLQFTSTLPGLWMLFMDGPDRFSYGSELIGTHLKYFLDSEPEKVCSHVEDATSFSSSPLCLPKLHFKAISLADVNTFVKDYKPLKA